MRDGLATQSNEIQYLKKLEVSKISQRDCWFLK